MECETAAECPGTDDDDVAPHGTRRDTRAVRTEKSIWGQVQPHQCGRTFQQAQRYDAVRHRATIIVMSSYCSAGLNLRTSSTIESSNEPAGRSRRRRKPSSKRSSPNSSPAALNASVTPSV